MTALHPSSSRPVAILSHSLPELAPSASIGRQWLPRLQRAGPSASLDECRAALAQLPIVERESTMPGNDLSITCVLLKGPCLGKRERGVEARDRYLQDLGLYRRSIEAGRRGRYPRERTGDRSHLKDHGEGGNDESRSAYGFLA